MYLLDFIKTYPYKSITVYDIDRKETIYSGTTNALDYKLRMFKEYKVNKVEKEYVEITRML